MKKSLSMLCTAGLMAVIMSFAVFSTPVFAEQKELAKPVSPALSVIAQDNSMAMAGLIGNDICFEWTDFARALNVSKLDSVIITKAPEVALGELRVGKTVVNSGQKLSAASLSKMTYTAASADFTRASFSFATEKCGYEIPCELYLLSRSNSAPTLSSVGENYLNVSTHKNITLYGTLPCYDPDGDSTIIEIVSYPREGHLQLIDKHTGEYTYTPTSGYSGKDSFEYVARDIYGNYSASSKVSLEVTKPTVFVSFDDMESSPHYNAALTMAEEGIMSGTQVGSNTYFYPDGEVSRGEFTVMLLHAIGLDDVTKVTSTKFADDANIPDYMKDYIATAHSLGYIKGIPTENGMCFEADRAITRAEAAVMLGNVLNLSTPTVIPTFNDSAEIPVWAAPSVYSLNSIGVFSSTEGSISPMSTLKRGDAAQMLAGLMNYLD